MLVRYFRLNSIYHGAGIEAMSSPRTAPRQLFGILRCEGFSSQLLDVRKVHEGAHPGLPET
jgi:hypothetical protein